MSENESKIVYSGDSFKLAPDTQVSYGWQYGWPYAVPQSLSTREKLAYKIMKDFLAKSMEGVSEEAVIREAFRLADLFFTVSNEPKVEKEGDE